MDQVERSVAPLQREAAVVGWCAAVCFSAGTAILLARHLSIITPSLSNALFQVFLACGLIALSHSQLARRIGTFLTTRISK
jgi:hypothetical protein